MTNTISASKFGKDLKISKLALASGESVQVIMPDETVNLDVSREGEAYRITLVTPEPVNEELRARVQNWFDGFLERENIDDSLTKAQLKKAFEGISQLYKKRHRPAEEVDIAKLIPVPDFETTGADEKGPAQSYSYKEMMDAMTGTTRIKWGYLGTYGNDCAILEMPDKAVDLVIRRWSVKGGMRHEVMVVGHENTSESVVDRLRAQVNRFTELHLTEQGGMLAESVRNLIYKVQRLTANQQIEDMPNRSNLIEV